MKIYIAEQIKGWIDRENGKHEVISELIGAFDSK